MREQPTSGSSSEPTGAEAVQPPAADLPAGDSPDTDWSNLRRLEPAVRTVWLLGELLEAALLTAGVAVAELFWFGHYTRAYLPAGVLSAAAGAALFGFAFFWPGFRYRAWGYAVREHDVLIRFGVIWKMRRCIPRLRIQHVDIEAGPVDRAFGLVKLSLFTAGTIVAVATIPGLRPADAEALREQLLAVGRGHG